MSSAAVRADLTAVDRAEILAGNDANTLSPVSSLHYFDYQATTPLDPRVLAVMLPWLAAPANAHAIENVGGRAAAAAIERSREQVAALVGCDPDEITFTSGATEANNLVLRSVLTEHTVAAVSAIEHASVLQTVRNLAGKNIALLEIGVSEDGIFDTEALGAILPTGIDLVSVMAVNNEIGTVQPVEEIASLCDEHRTVFHSDVTQAVGKIPLSLARDRISFASFSSHKIYGPQGVGALFAARGTALTPLITGGEQEHS